VLRHAVHASKVASIGHRNTNVVYLPTKGINHVCFVLPDATEKFLRLLALVSLFCWRTNLSKAWCCGVVAAGPSTLTGHLTPPVTGHPQQRHRAQHVLRVRLTPGILPVSAMTVCTRGALVKLFVVMQSACFSYDDSESGHDREPYPARSEGRSAITTTWRYATRSAGTVAHEALARLARAPTGSGGH
jgi:hypothetical protein